jgi:hypothetical protein
MFEGYKGQGEIGNICQTKMCPLIELVLYLDLNLIWMVGNTRHKQTFGDTRKHQKLLHTCFEKTTSLKWQIVVGVCPCAIMNERKDI